MSGRTSFDADAFLEFRSRPCFFTSFKLTVGFFASTSLFFCRCSLLDMARVCIFARSAAPLVNTRDVLYGESQFTFKTLHVKRMTVFISYLFWNTQSQQR